MIKKITLLAMALCVSKLCAAAQPALWNVPVYYEPFWGREAHLHTLHTKAGEGPVVVTGLSGVGKSRLSFTYAKKYAHSYRVVWVFDASKSMENQVIDFANKLYAMQHGDKKAPFTKKEEASHYMKNLLRTCSFSWLLIFDAASSFAAVKDSIPETFSAKNKQVIVTSLSDQDARGVLRVDALTDAEAQLFLHHYLKDETDEDIAKLAHLLGNHPLALLQAATYITATPNMNISAYCAFFSKNKTAYWASESKVLGTQPQLYTAIKMSIAKLKDDSFQNYSLLVAMCLMDSHKLDGAIIQTLYQHIDKGDMAGFGKILDVSLITNVEPHIYALHDYVRDVVLATADADTQKTAGEIAVNSLLSLFPEKIEDCVEVFEKNPALLRHVKSLLVHMNDLPETEIFALGVRAFYYTYYYLRDYTYSDALSDRLSSFLKDKDIKNDLLVASFHSANASVTFLRHGMPSAIKELELAKKIFEKMDPELVRSELILLIGNNLGFKYYWQGNVEEVQKCLDEAERYQKGHTDIMGAVVVGCLRAILAQDRGKFNESLQVLNTLIAAVEKDPTENKTMGHYLNSLKACTLLKLSQMCGLAAQVEESVLFAKQALQVSEGAYAHAVASSDGRNDTDIVARTLIYLSMAQSGNGQGQQAEKSAKQAIAIFDRELMGPYKNRRQALSHMALGDAYMAQKKYEAAFNAYLEAEKVYDIICTHKAFDDISELYMKMVRTANAMKDSAHRRLYAKKHYELFGVNHPRFDEIFFVLRSNGESAVF